jgi:four helix bundle protein
MQDFRKLAVWQKSHELTLSLYALTGKFPREEMYGLTSQVRRASSSIPANIAEGCGRDGDAELSRFLQIAMGSASELEYHLLLARDLKYLTAEDYQLVCAIVNEVKRMLARLIRSLRPLAGQTTARPKIRQTERLRG